MSRTEKAIKIINATRGNRSSSPDDGRVRPKEVAGWATLGLLGYFGWKLFFAPDEDDERKKFQAEALKRWGYYKQFTSSTMFVSIAKKWEEDNKPKKLSQSGGTATLVGPNNMAGPSLNIAKAIYECKGTFGDNEGLLYVSVGRIKTLAQFFLVQDTWKGIGYKGNFMDYIGSFTNEQEKIRIVIIFDKLPYYFGGKERDVPKPKKEWLQDL